MELARGVDHLKTECIFVSPDSLNLAAVAHPYNDHGRPATPTQGSTGIIRIANLCQQRFGGPHSRRRKVRSRYAPSSIDFVTTGTTCFAEEQGLAGAHAAGIYSRLLTYKNCGAKSEKG